LFLGCGSVRCLYCDALDLGVGLVRARARSGRLHFLVFSSRDLFSALSIYWSASVSDFGVRSRARQVSCSRSDLERDRFPARGLRWQVSGSGFGYLIQFSREVFQARLVSVRCKNR
jgi:hypothetical protein